MSPKEQIEAIAREFHLRAQWEFVPFSKSRNAAEKHPSLNWRYSLKNDLREILNGDYMQGCGHTAAYKEPVSTLGHRDSVMRDKAVREECETGRSAVGHAGKVAPPEIAELLYSVASDADAIDCATYEEWADSLGYGRDSRKGEAIYRQCLEIGLKLRATLGDDGLRRLREACQDY